MGHCLHWHHGPVGWSIPCCIRTVLRRAALLDGAQSGVAELPLLPPPALAVLCSLSLCPTGLHLPFPALPGLDPGVLLLFSVILSSSPCSPPALGLSIFQHPSCSGLSPSLPSRSGRPQPHPSPPKWLWLTGAHGSGASHPTQSILSSPSLGHPMSPSALGQSPVPAPTPGLTAAPSAHPRTPCAPHPLCISPPSATSRHRFPPFSNPHPQRHRGLGYHHQSSPTAHPPQPAEVAPSAG